jgi:hypothetical protein
MFDIIKVRGTLEMKVHCAGKVLLVNNVILIKTKVRFPNSRILQSCFEPPVFFCFILSYPILCFLMNLVTVIQKREMAKAII